METSHTRFQFSFVHVPKFTLSFSMAVNLTACSVFSSRDLFFKSCMRWRMREPLLIMMGHPGPC
jgi:hypothetical protein